MIMTKVGAYSIIRVHALVFGSEAGAVAQVAAHWIIPAALVTLVDEPLDLGHVHDPLGALVRGGLDVGHALGDALVELVPRPAEQGAAPPLVDPLAPRARLRPHVCETPKSS